MNFCLQHYINKILFDHIRWECGRQGMTCMLCKINKLENDNVEILYNTHIQKLFIYKIHACQSSGTLNSTTQEEST